MIQAEEFANLLALIDHERPGYRKSLGAPARDPAIPELLKPLYAHIHGTPRRVPFEPFMDFIPGYRLMEVTEVEAAFVTMPDLVSFLANYSGDTICVDSDGVVHHVPHGFENSSMFASLQDMVRMLWLCYSSGVYFVDSAGYLDINSDAEWDLGRDLNPGCSYWSYEDL